MKKESNPPPPDRLKRPPPPPAPPSKRVSGHDWDDQDKCKKCGDCDWYAGPVCNGKPSQSADRCPSHESEQSDSPTRDSEGG